MDKYGASIGHARGWITGKGRRTKRLLLATTMLGVFVGTIGDGAVASPASQRVYFSGFENGAGPEWSKPIVDVTPIGGRHFLGQFSKEWVSLHLTGLPSHTNVRVEFDLYVIQSWDGNAPPTDGPDLFDLYVGRTTNLIHTSFSNIDFYRQSAPDRYPQGDHPAHTGADEVDTLGYTFAGDSVYHLTGTFSHTGGELALVFWGRPNQPITDESWGIDNVKVDVA